MSFSNQKRFEFNNKMVETVVWEKCGKGSVILNLYPCVRLIFLEIFQEK